MGKSNTKKRFVVLVAIIALIAFIGIGYAAFSQNLTVSGNATFNSDFKVGFLNVQETEAGKDLGEMKISETDPSSVTIKLTALKPGDTYTATVDVKNTGSIDAKYNGITPATSNATATGVEYSFTTTAEPGALLEAKSTTPHTFTFTFTWSADATEAITAVTFEFSYTINYVQA